MSGEIDDGITDYLSGTVISNITTAVDFEERYPLFMKLTIGGEKVIIAAGFADRVGVVVLGEKDGIRDFAFDPLREETFLKFPGVCIIGPAYVDECRYLQLCSNIYCVTERIFRRFHHRFAQRRVSVNCPDDFVRRRFQFLGNAQFGN